MFRLKKNLVYVCEEKNIINFDAVLMTVVALKNWPQYVISCVFVDEQLASVRPVWRSCAVGLTGSLMSSGGAVDGAHWIFSRRGEVSLTLHMQFLFSLPAQVWPARASECVFARRRALEECACASVCVCHSPAYMGISTQTHIPEK